MRDNDMNKFEDEQRQVGRAITKNLLTKHLRANVLNPYYYSAQTINLLA